MKLKKIFGLALAGVTAASMFSFAGCDVINSLLSGNGDNSGTTNNPGMTSEFVMEAEYINLDGVTGAGLSSNQEGVSMIYGDGTDAQKQMWSNGYYVGYTYTTNLQLDFVFTSDKVTTGTLVLMLGSELGDLSISDSDFAVLVNGEKQNFSGWFVENSADMSQAKFSKCTLPGAINIKAGENTISLVILENKFKGGSATGGPMIDCLKITSDAGLTWSPKTDNPDRRGEI